MKRRSCFAVEVVFLGQYEAFSHLRWEPKPDNSDVVDCRLPVYPYLSMIFAEGILKGVSPVVLLVEIEKNPEQPFNFKIPPFESTETSMAAFSLLSKSKIWAEQCNVRSKGNSAQFEEYGDVGNCTEVWSWNTPGRKGNLKHIEECIIAQCSLSAKSRLDVCWMLNWKFSCPFAALSSDCGKEAEALGFMGNSKAPTVVHWSSWWP